MQELQDPHAVGRFLLLLGAVGLEKLDHVGQQSGQLKGLERADELNQHGLFVDDVHVGRLEAFTFLAPHNGDGHHKRLAMKSGYGIEQLGDGLVDHLQKQKETKNPNQLTIAIAEMTRTVY